jgi:hypothetical protein
VHFAGNARNHLKKGLIERGFSGILVALLKAFSLLNLDFTL